MHLLSTVVSWGLLVLCLSAIWYYGYSIYAARDLFSRKAQVNGDFVPPISILKPLRGVDSFAYENLASFCRQDYPKFQIVFGMLDPDDPAVSVARQIQNDFPDIDIRIVTEGRQIGSNLKVSNLANMQAQATYPILLISDSDIRVGPDYLRNVVRPLRDSDAGVVTCMYRSVAPGWAAAIEGLGISTEFHAGVLTARKLEGMRFALGATILIKREALDAIGGFTAVADYLGDDFLLGNLPARAGYSVVLSEYVVDHVLDTASVGDLLLHQIRWARSTRASRPWGYVGLIFTHGTATSLLFLLATRGLPIGWWVLGLTISARMAMAWIVGIKYLRDPVARRLLWLVPFRDVMSFVLWICSFIGNTIEWRGRRFRLAAGGRLVAIEE
jgi:ceramide glucosyltransferase